MKFTGERKYYLLFSPVNESMLLRNQIESVAGKHNVVHFSLSTFSCGYHLIDVNKMIQYILSYIGTCFFCLLAAMCHESCFLAVMRCKPSFTA